MHTKTWYAGGVEMPAKDVKNHPTKRIWDKGEGRPFAWVTDTLRIIDGKIDESDPVIKELEKILHLPMDKLLIIVMIPDVVNDPLSYPRTAIYGWY